MEATRLQTLWSVSICFTVYFAFNGCFIQSKVMMTQPVKMTPTVNTVDKRVHMEANKTSSSNNLLISSGIGKKGMPNTHGVLGKSNSIEAKLTIEEGLLGSLNVEERPVYGIVDEKGEVLDGDIDELQNNDEFEMINFRRRSRYDIDIMGDRLKRHIFGKDSRVHVSPPLTEQFPFASVVRLLSGCTGTLIWYKHVLTSAHCVHDGKKFIPLSKLKVGILRETGTFKWFSVKKVHVANQWLRKQRLEKIGHDFAVLELTKKHGRPYMSFGAHPSRTGRSIQFAGFPADKPINQMWFTQCIIRKYSKRILYNGCDAWPGMSGSGVYVYDKHPFDSQKHKRPFDKGSHHHRKVVAIFSSFRLRIGKNGKYMEGHNIATRLTKKKVERICHWIKAGRGCKYLRR